MVVVPAKPDPKPVPPPPPGPTKDKQGTGPVAVPQLALMMPFFGDRFAAEGRNELPPNSEWAVNYFAGVKMGLLDLEAKGQKATIHVFDSQGDAGVAQRLISDPDIRASQCLIAPYLTPAVKAVIAPAQAIALPLIVPFSAASDLATDYPQMLQMNPGLPTHLDQMALYLTKTYKAEQVVLLGLPTGEQNSMVSYLLAKQRELAPKQTAWRTWRLESSSNSMTGLNWDGRFATDGTSVFVFPIYDNPDRINGFMSQMQLYKRGRTVELVGMPQWAEMKQLDPTLMESHGVTITSGPMIDYDDFEVQSFVERFSAQYNAPPDLPAFLGYDAVSYALPLMSKYGLAWTQHLPKSYNGLVSKYELRPSYPSNTTSAASEQRADRQENVSVRVLHFRNFGFGAEDR